MREKTELMLFLKGKGVVLEVARTVSTGFYFLKVDSTTFCTSNFLTRCVNCKGGPLDMKQSTFGGISRHAGSSQHVFCFLHARQCVNIECV